MFRFLKNPIATLGAVLVVTFFSSTSWAEDLKVVAFSWGDIRD